MPILEQPGYNPPFLFKNRHLHTIMPSLLRKVNAGKPERIRLETPDVDFIEIDHYSNQNKVVAIITHGLEGNSRKPYVLGTVNVLLQSGFDAIAVNLRGCSGIHNILPSSYHAGKTDDLEFVIQYAIKKLNYSKIILIGFSLGGNISLKYLGESGINVFPEVIGGVGISVPCDLKSTSYKLSKPYNILYLSKFLRSLKKKASYKIDTFKLNKFIKSEILRAKSFFEFDNLFTAPVHGFKNAEEYWSMCSSINSIEFISVPTLLLNSLDDPFLSKECFPYIKANQNPNFFLISPKYGGHVGFANDIFLKKTFFYEEIVIDFCKKIITNTDYHSTWSIWQK